MSYRRLIGFGEAMLRLTAPVGGSIETAAELRASVGGAELNGLIAAARDGMPGAWVTGLPGNALGRLVLRHARANGVEVRNAAAGVAGAQRLGLYFLEPATPPRPPAITYDRGGSAFAQLAADAVAWNHLLDADTCLYVTGITPPLGQGPRAVMDAAIATAREVGATVALDVNYRQALWSREDFSDWLTATLPVVNIVSASADDLRAAGVVGDDPFAEAIERFGLQAAITTTKARDGQTMELTVRAVTPDGEHEATARATVVDQIGAGDAMFGAFLAHLPAGELAVATRAALGAAVTCYGLFGDALVTDRWDPAETRGVIR